MFFRSKIARISDSLRGLFPRVSSNRIFLTTISNGPFVLAEIGCVLTGYGNEVVWLFSFLPTLRRVILPVPSHVLGTGLLIT